MRMAHNNTPSDKYCESTQKSVGIYIFHIDQAQCITHTLQPNNSSNFELVYYYITET